MEYFGQPIITLNINGDNETIIRYNQCGYFYIENPVMGYRVSFSIDEDFVDMILGFLKENSDISASCYSRDKFERVITVYRRNEIFDIKIGDNVNIVINQRIYYNIEENNKKFENIDFFNVDEVRVSILIYVQDAVTAKLNSIGCKANNIEFEKMLSEHNDC